MHQVSSGLRHTAVVTHSGRVLLSGSGRKGQLGITDENGSALKECDQFTEGRMSCFLMILFLFKHWSDIKLMILVKHVSSLSSHYALDLMSSLILPNCSFVNAVIDLGVNFSEKYSTSQNGCLWSAPHHCSHSIVSHLYLGWQQIWTTGLGPEGDVPRCDSDSSQFRIKWPTIQSYVWLDPHYATNR